MGRKLTFISDDEEALQRAAKARRLECRTQSDQPRTESENPYSDPSFFSRRTRLRIPGTNYLLAGVAA